MANPEHLAILEQGVAAWNEWRKANLHLEPDLSSADLRSAKLRDVDLRRTNLAKADLTEATLLYADLRGADLTEARLVKTDLRSVYLARARMQSANLTGANLRWASLQKSDLTGAILRGAELYWALMERTKLEGADLTGAMVYGTAVWNPELEGAIQNDMVVTYRNEAKVTVDSLEMAQFVYLLLKNEKVREVIDTVTSKVVLILGRFSEERKRVLDALRQELRRHDYVPVIFDFEKPVDKSIADTVTTLAKLARFVIADVTDASWITVEAQLVVRECRSVPFRLIKHDSASVPSPINDLRPDAPQLIEPFEYRSLDHAVASIESIVEPAEAMAEKIRLKRKAIENDPW